VLIFAPVRRESINAPRAPKAEHGVCGTRVPPTQRRNTMRPKINELTIPAHTSRMLAQVAVCSLALALLLGIGANHVAAPEGAESAATGAVWSAEHGAIEGTPDPVPVTF
jgi:hypothetical protein